jgi:hypothetical protein
VKLVRRECGLHEIYAFNVREAGHTVKMGWSWMRADLLMDLEACPTAKLPSVEYVGGGNCSKAFEELGSEERSRRMIARGLSGVGSGVVCKCGN